MIGRSHEIRDSIDFVENEKTDVVCVTLRIPIWQDSAGNTDENGQRPRQVILDDYDYHGTIIFF